MKRVMIITLILSLALCGFAYAHTDNYYEREHITSESGEFVYCLRNDKKAAIVGYAGSETEIVIPEELDGIPVVEVCYMERPWKLEPTSVTIPKSVKTLLNNPFIDLGSLKEIRVAEDNPELEIRDGALFSKADHCLICCPPCLSVQEFTVPEGTEIIGRNAFWGCEGLVSVSLPESLKKIGDNAFRKCSGLKGLDIPDSVTDIGFSPFDGCVGMESIRLPAGLEKIGNNMLAGMA